MGFLSRMFIPRGARRAVHRRPARPHDRLDDHRRPNGIASAANRPGGGAYVAIRLAGLAADPDVGPVS
jgi:hypothetical protein